MFRKIFIPALISAWHSKKAWIIALLTITPLTILNEWRLTSKISSAINDPQDYFWFFSKVKIDAFGFKDILETAITDPIGIISLLLMVVLVITLVFFFAWILVNAQAILIYTQAPKHKKNNYSFQAALSKIEKNWIPLLQLNFVLVVARILAISVLLISTALLANGFGSFINSTLFAAVIISITLFSFTIRLTIFKVVLEKKEIRVAFSEARDIVKNNAVACYELSFILYAFMLLFLVIVVSLILLIVTPLEFGVTVLAILLLKTGIVPFIIIISVSLILAITAGWIALVEYNVWLTWYTEVTEHGTVNAYTNKFVNFIRSHVKRTKIN